MYLPPMSRELPMQLTGMQRGTGKVGGLFCNQRTGSNKPGHRNCNRIYGFRTDGGDHLQT